MKRVFPFLLAMALWAALLCAASGEQTVDVDLSACNRKMTFAQMKQVYNFPQDYAGKLFRLNGQFCYSQLYGQAKIIICDTTGCCDVTVFFQPSQALTYPDDYPPLYADILLTARLGVDPDDPNAPCYFYDAMIEWENGSIAQ